MDLSKKLVFTILPIWLFFTRTHCDDSGSLAYLSVPENYSELNISEQCALDIHKLNANLKNLTTWAVEMWEATVKTEIGLLRGNYHQLGNFDQCLVSRMPGAMKRQYCLVKLIVEDELLKTSSEFTPDLNNARDIILRDGDAIRWTRNQLLWAVCTPASCSIPDLKIILKDFKYFTRFSEGFNLTQRLEFDEKYCQTDPSDEPFTFGSIAFITTFGILVLLASLSTAYHLFAQSSKDVNFPPFIKAFSVINNVKQLCTKDDEDLRATYGLRVLTTGFIIGCHLISALATGPLFNREHMELLTLKPFFAMVPQLTGTFVDTFFVLGGFFAIYSLTKNYAANKSIPHIILTRYVRIMPIYAFLVFFMATLMPQSGSGPLWNAVNNETQYCREHWWTNLLLINNYVHSDTICMIHSWYIPCDFHFYLISIFIVHFLSNPKKEKTGLAILISLLCISFVIPPLIIYLRELPPILYFSNHLIKLVAFLTFFNSIYIKSHTRFSSYGLGLLTGYFYMKYKKKSENKMSDSLSTAIFCAAIFVYFAISFVLILCFDPNPPYDPVRSSIFAAFYRPIKALCMCVVLLVCIFGNIPVIKYVLGCMPMIFFGKLTYGAYLISLIVQYRDIGTLRVPMFWNLIPTISLHTWYYEFSFVLSFFGYILIEAPCNNLLKSYLRSKECNQMVNGDQSNQRKID